MNQKQNIQWFVICSKIRRFGRIYQRTIILHLQCDLGRSILNDLKKINN